MDWTVDPEVYSLQSTVTVGNKCTCCRLWGLQWGVYSLQWDVGIKCTLQ